MERRNDELNLRAALLMLIDQHRNDSGNLELGLTIERVILEENWRELDRDITADPGALEGQLVLLHPKRSEVSLR
jgi:hypothetical protein